MAAEVSIELQKKDLIVEIQPALFYSPAIITLEVEGTVIHIAASKEQLGEIHQAIGQHLELEARKGGVAS